MTTTTPETRCSQVVREPLPGTAKTGTTYVALEHLRGWGRDVLDGEALGEELTPLVADHLKKWSAGGATSTPPKDVSHLHRRWRDPARHGRT